MKNSPLKHNLSIIKVKHIYKVTFGKFKSRSDALIALDGLPIDHAKVKAWVLPLPDKVNIIQRPQPPKKVMAKIVKPKTIKKLGKQLLQLPKPSIHASVKHPKAYGDGEGSVSKENLLPMPA